MLRSTMKILALVAMGITDAHALMSGYRDMPDQSVQTPLGSVTVTHLRYILQGGVYTLKGQVTDNTGHYWTELVLGVTLSDRSGPVQVRPTWMDPWQSQMFIHVADLRAGATKEFKFTPFAHADKDTVVPVLTYSDGEFPVAYTFTLIKPTAAASPSVETSAYALAFEVAATGIQFTLKNKGSGPIRIDWNSVAYVDVSGQSQGVIHNGIKYADRTAPKAPTIVPPGATVSDTIVPVNNVEWLNADWVTHPLLPSGPSALKLIGSELSVFLPLDIEGKTDNQLFVFKIASAK